MLDSSFPILLAEDNRADVVLFREVMREARIQFPLHVVHDGQEAIDYLEGRPPYGDRQQCPLPKVIVLDLKMPRVDGFEVLVHIRASRALKKVPVIILSSSALTDDINRAYALGANTYMVKPVSYEAWGTVFRLCFDYWTQAASHPDYTESGLDPQPIPKAA